MDRPDPATDRALRPVADTLIADVQAFDPSPTLGTMLLFVDERPDVFDGLDPHDAACWLWRRWKAERN